VFAPTGVIALFAPMIGLSILFVWVKARV
jgi:hypothetical protein